MYVSVIVRESTCRCLAEVRGSDSLELELQGIVSCFTWVLGTNPRSTEKQYSLLTAEPAFQPMCADF